MKSQKFFAYLRKSSTSEDRQAASIPAQTTEVLEVARRHNVAIIGNPLVEMCSAKRPGRPVFNTMVERLERGEATGIICWHLNRLARNPLDGGRLMQALADGVIEQIVTPGRVFTKGSDDKLMMSIEFGMSTKYSDDLAEVIRRGQRQALESGRWPHRDKIGYMRDHRTRLSVPDPDRFSSVRKLWELKIRGWSTPEILTHARTVLCLTTPQHGKRGGGLIAPSTLFRVLNDPFYAGVMRHGGQTYQGLHKPMITWEQFQQVQGRFSVAQASSSRPKHLRFVYRGMIHCGACNAIVTAERTTNRHGTSYTHYHCCRKRREYRFCPQRSVQEGYIDERVASAICQLQISDDLAELLLEALPSVLTQHVNEHKKNAAQIGRRLGEIDRQMSRLRLLCAQEVIRPEELAIDREHLLDERHELEQQQLSLDEPQRLLEPWKSAISLLNGAKRRFVEGDNETRRHLVQDIFSNLVLKDKILLSEAKPVYRRLAEFNDVSLSRTTRDDVRTFISEHIDFLEGQK